METENSLTRSYNSLSVILKQINQFYTTPNYFFKIHFNITFTFAPRSSRSMWTFTFLLHTLCTSVFSSICVICPPPHSSQPPNVITLKISDVRYKSPNFLQLYSNKTSFLLSQNFFLRTPILKHSSYCLP